MPCIKTTLLAVAGLTIGALAAVAQTNSSAVDRDVARARTNSSDSAKKDQPTAVAKYFVKTVPGTRPYDQRGVNMFETAKPAPNSFTGPSLDIGAAFSQSFQVCNSRTPRPRGSSTARTRTS